jgi:hypothetical protein
MKRHVITSLARTRIGAYLRNLKEVPVRDLAIQEDVNVRTEVVR